MSSSETFEALQVLPQKNLVDFKQTGPSRDAVGLQRGCHCKADSLIRTRKISNDKIGRKRVQFPFDALDRCIE